ncbi:MAG TPA: hypothetical protein VFS10_09770, partial [Pyrinomonadaceae bacterium]|nr:hypothetical protein [Pyrinomonadaceae bacterium]
TRLAAARVVRDFPLALEFLARGDIHLCGLTELRRVLTPENHEALLREASGKSTRALREMIAARAPKPDVAASIEPVAPQTSLPSLAIGGSSNAPPEVSPRPKMEPLSATRYRLEVTVSAETKGIVEEIKDLMAHRNPTRDLEVILEAALRDLRDKLQKERYAKTSRPRKFAKASTRPGYVTSAVRREVFERDGAQCTFVDDQGRRCEERGCLEIHHLVSKALGGPDTVENLTVRCRPHNRHDAEKVFGREHVEERIRCERSKRQAKRSPAFETAERGLVGDFEFAPKDVRAALAKVAGELGSSTTSPEEVIRAALRLLT